MHSYSEIAKILDSTPMRTHDNAVEWLRAEGKLAEGEGVTVADCRLILEKPETDS